MKRSFKVILMVALAITVLFGVACPAYAMTPSQQAAYDAWYLSRFGRLPNSSPATPADPTTPVDPTPTNPSPPAGLLPKGPIQPVSPSPFEQSIWELVNKERTSRGLKPVGLDPRISAVARVKGEDMAANGYYGHGGSYGYSGTMLSYFGISVKLSRENLAQGTTAQQAHTILMNSTSHRENILEPAWTDVGIGVVKRPGSSFYFVVEIFVRK